MVNSHSNCIVFDLFHTLVDPEDFRPKSFQRAERAASLLQLDKEAFSKYWKDTLTLRNTSSTTIASLLESYLSKTGRTVRSGLISKIDHELGQYQDMAILNPRVDVLSSLQSLVDSGFKLGILSNCDEREVREWKHSPIAPFFGVACFSYMIGRQKPDREAYLTVLDRLGVSPRQTVYVGDGGSNELEGARNVGFGQVVFMRGFVSSNGLRSDTELNAFSHSANVTIDSIGELPAVLGRH